MCYNREECILAGILFDANLKFLKLSNKEFGIVQTEIEDVPYKVGVGSLMYAMVGTRTDLAFAMSIVSQFILKVGPLHWMVVIYIMRYLNSTLYLKLCLGCKDIVLRRFLNANWAGDTNNWWSTTGYVFFVDVEVISWNYKNTTNHRIVYNEGGVHGH